MKLNLTLSQKALLLVCIPLLFEIAFVGILAHLLQQAEHERAMEAHAKEVQSRVNSILGVLIDAGARIIFSEAAKKQNVSPSADDRAAVARHEYQQLAEFVAGFPQEEKSVRRIGKIYKAMEKNMDSARQDSRDGNQLMLIRDFGNLQALMGEFSETTREITAQQKEIERARSAARVRARSRVTGFLYSGLFFNIALAVGLALYFNRGTASRMTVLMDNTRRLARGERLNPPIGGVDEIAQLDRTFQEMAGALEAAARKERAIIANARDVICSLDKSLVFSAVNPACLTVWGYSAEDLAGRPLDTIVPAEEIAGIKAAFAKIAGNEAAPQAESRVVGSNGNETDMLWSVQWSDQEQSYFCVAHDITERKQIERLKREFVAMVSHDLRTPLTSIQGFLSLLDAGAYGELTDSGLESLDLVSASISRLMRLINDLLDAERLESGKLELQLASVSVLDILEQSGAAVENYAQKQGVKILLEPDESATELKITADGDRLIQVLVNLVSNAIKFSPSGSRIRLCYQNLEEQVEIKVIDEGRGIPAEFLNSIFERFRQVKKSDAKNRQGTGLGLSIARAIVEKHGGTIGVTSQEGKGSTFWFRIPKKPLL
jgi:PAS domain S-box-containing protein